MLKTRLITAFILIPIVLLALFVAPVNGWRAAIFGVLLLSAWEWTRLAGWQGLPKFAYIGLTGLGLPVLMWAWQLELVRAILVVSTIGFWFLIVPLWLIRKARINHAGVMAVAGWLTMLPFALSMILWREVASNPLVGAYLLLGIISLVAIADSSAYFAGKRFGKHKLAPAISPGKTWEGALGAMVGVSLLLWGVNSLPAVASLSISPLLLAGVVLVATPLSIMGDLFESWLKRCAGIKDSSQLLPGHGGVLDRLDALMAVVSVSYMLFRLAWG